MKLAVSTYSLLRWRRESARTLEDSLKWIADAGVKGVEFAPVGDEGAVVVEKATQLRELCENLGLIIASYCVGADLLAESEQQRKVIEQLKRHVDVTAELGAPSMRHDVTRGWAEHARGIDGPQTFERALEVVTPAIREVADYGATVGVKTSLENHGFYMQAAQRVQKLLETVAHPNYGLTIDLGNFLCVNDDPVAAAARLAKWVIMAHAKDFHVRPKETMPPSGWFATPTEIALRGAICGHGVIDVPAQLRLLKQAGYDGWLSLEFEGMEEAGMGVKLGLEYLSKQLSSLA
jgi:sugar phosphate isomerase/epimerase